MGKNNSKEFMKEYLEIINSDYALDGRNKDKKINNIDDTLYKLPIHLTESFLKEEEEFAKSLLGFQLDSEALANKIRMYLNGKNMTQEDLANSSHLNKQVISKTINCQTEPSRDTMLCICLGLRLSLVNAVDLMRLAGYEFDRKRPKDIFTYVALKHKVYNIVEVNNHLHDNGFVDEILGNSTK